jgi:hypothetical protein
VSIYSTRRHGLTRDSSAVSFEFCFRFEIAFRASRRRAVERVDTTTTRSRSRSQSRGRIEFREPFRKDRRVGRSVVVLPVRTQTEPFVGNERSDGAHDTDGAGVR